MYGGLHLMRVSVNLPLLTRSAFCVCFSIQFRALLLQMGAPEMRLFRRILVSLRFSTAFSANHRVIGGAWLTLFEIFRGVLVL